MLWIAPSEKDAGSTMLEKRLWDAADQFRANSDLKAAEYSQPILGLIFLRFAGVRFDAQRAKLEQATASSRRGSRLDDPAAYHSAGVLYLAPDAHFDHLLSLPESADIGKAVNEFMSLLLAAIVVYGFSQTVNEDLLHASPVPPGILWVHSMVYPGWVLFFILQSGLVQTRNMRVHRLLGFFGVALAVTMVVVGWVTVIDMDRFIRDSQHYAGIVPFTIVQLADLPFFAAVLAAAIYYRRQPEFHRRADAGGLLLACGSRFFTIPAHAALHDIRVRGDTCSAWRRA